MDFLIVTGSILAFIVVCSAIALVILGGIALFVTWISSDFDNEETSSLWKFLYPYYPLSLLILLQLLYFTEPHWVHFTVIGISCTFIITFYYHERYKHLNKGRLKRRFEV